MGVRLDFSMELIFCIVTQTCLRESKCLVLCRYSHWKSSTNTRKHLPELQRFLKQFILLKEHSCETHETAQVVKGLLISPPSAKDRPVALADHGVGVLWQRMTKGDPFAAEHRKERVKYWSREPYLKLWLTVYHSSHVQEKDAGFTFLLGSVWCGILKLNFLTLLCNCWRNLYNQWFFGTKSL